MLACVKYWRVGEVLAGCTGCTGELAKAVKEGVFCKVGAGIGFDWSGWEEEVG